MKVKKIYKVKKDKGTVQYVHRFVMEQYIGRKLSNKEIVHHKNGNKADNRIKNLEIVTRAEHAHIHNKGRKNTWGHKTSKTLKGHFMSEKTKKKISKTCKGRIPWNKGKKLGKGFYKKK